MTYVDYIGLAAGTCSTFAFAPQAVRVWKTRQVSQLSIGMLSLMSVGAVLWLTYGLFRNDISIISANLATLLFILYMMFHKVNDGRRTGSW